MTQNRMIILMGSKPSAATTPGTRVHHGCGETCLAREDFVGGSVCGRTVDRQGPERHRQITLQAGTVKGNGSVRRGRRSVQGRALGGPSVADAPRHAIPKTC